MIILFFIHFRYIVYFILFHCCRRHGDVQKSNLKQLRSRGKNVPSFKRKLSFNNSARPSSAAVVKLTSPKNKNANIINMELCNDGQSSKEKETTTIKSQSSDFINVGRNSVICEKLNISTEKGRANKHSVYVESRSESTCLPKKLTVSLKELGKSMKMSELCNPEEEHDQTIIISSDDELDTTFIETVSDGIKCSSDLDDFSMINLSRKLAERNETSFELNTAEKTFHGSQIEVFNEITSVSSINEEINMTLSNISKNMEIETDKHGILQKQKVQHNKRECRNDDACVIDHKKGEDENSDKKLEVDICDDEMIKMKSDEISSTGENIIKTVNVIDDIVINYDREKKFIPLAGTSKQNHTLSINIDNSNCIKSETGSSSYDSIPLYQTKTLENRESESESEPKFSSLEFPSSFNSTEELQKYYGNLGSLTTPDGCGIIVPEYNPPTKAMLLSSLSKYGIPQIRQMEPFYSDPDDVTGNMEVGNKVLKIASKSVKDLCEFDTLANGIEYHRKLALKEIHGDGKLTHENIRNYKLAFSEDKECVITPVTLPPNKKEVKEWLNKRICIMPTTSRKSNKQRVLIPLSPGNDNEDVSCDSISLSSCDSYSSNDTLTQSKIDCLEDETDASPVIKKSASLRRHKSRNYYKSEKTIFNSDKAKYYSSKNASTGIESQLQQSIESKKIHLHDETQKFDPKVIPISNVKSCADHSFGNLCQITGAGFDNTHNFAASLKNLQEAKALSEFQYLTILSMELHVKTRGDLKPDPILDPIQAIIYAIFNDAPEDMKRSENGAFVVNNFLQSPKKNTRVRNAQNNIGVVGNVKCLDSENEMIDAFVNFIKKVDPDVLVGYEIQMASWGYLIERGYMLNSNLQASLSRVPNDKMKIKDEEHMCDVTITGRIVLDFWRLMRYEIAVQSYTLENIIYHLLHERVPLFTFKELSFWWSHPTNIFRQRVLNYYLFRVKAILRLMDQLDFIGQKSELARLFGIQFYEVLSRGSQFRVESMMLRLAKPSNYIPVSPSIQQKAHMRAPESLPLILEPESKFYTDPIIVLDFQSLYPSMIIAYNYCFSTCLGRMEHLGKKAPFEFGATQLKVSRIQLAKLLTKDKLNFSPCGVAFVNNNVREGIVPKMLSEILDTRLMVKKSMKENPNDKNLQKVLHARQLGLKLIANVTYGYAAANYSGRMPCVEVADSVVSKGRETLQRAIALVENTTKWGARVVYGDTDSLFVLIAGRSKEDAFKIGGEIAEAVTNDNPSPVRLKLEKIFHPCILQTKKRYVGYQYDSVSQNEPEFCAKGIETVRRDGCPAASKVLCCLYFMGYTCPI